MNYNYMFLFLQKLQLGPIDAACQGLQYALQNSARAIFSFFYFSVYCFWFYLFDSTAKFFKIVCTSSKFNTLYFS